MSTAFLIVNNVSTSLAAPITTTTATTLTLSSTTGAPSPTGGQIWPITLNDLATGGIYEIVYCTARSGAVCTIVRGQEGTAATTWLANDLAYADSTAAILNNFALINGSATQAFATNALSAAGLITASAGITSTTGVFSSTLTANGVLALGAAGIGALPNGQAIDGGANLNLNTATGANISFGSGASQALLFGTMSASGLQIAPTINALNVLGNVPPVYSAAGAAYGSSIHIVGGQVTAVGSTTTVTLSGSAGFGGNNFFIGVMDASASVANPAVTLISNTSFSFASTSAHVYNYFVFGL